MALPTNLQEQIEELLHKVRNHPQHQLKPVERYKLYKLLDPDVECYILHPVLGHLAILTARRVLPFWEQAMPFYTDGDPEDNNDNLPHFLIECAERIFRGQLDLETARQIAGNNWYIMSNITHLELQQRDDISAIKASYVGEAALMALNETLSGSSLDNSIGWESCSDDDPTYRRGDTASEAVKAYSGTGSFIDFKKRLEFWEWWLLEAIPAAWEASKIPFSILPNTESYYRYLANRPLEEEELESLIFSLQDKPYEL